MKYGQARNKDDISVPFYKLFFYDGVQAMCLPLGASVSLLIMFFFFDSMQVQDIVKLLPATEKDGR
jgi:hypothetical protein